MTTLSARLAFSLPAVSVPRASQRAAVGAVAGVVLAAGPLLPVGNAEFTDNFRSSNALVDLPTMR